MEPSSTRLKITEIFHSIQGESTLAGVRTCFVRLTGCPLRCTYCDTKYSYTGGQWMGISEIIDRVRSFDVQHVCVTGGEPLAQKNTIELVRQLVAGGWSISIETDGEEDVGEYAPLAKIVLDIKTPGSGEAAERCFANLSVLKATDEIKFVICDRADYEWSKEIISKHELTERFVVLFSPAFKEGLLRQLAEWIIEDRLDVRLQTQLHKHIWGENTQGV